MTDYKNTQKQNIKELVDTLQESLNYRVYDNSEGLVQMLANQAIALDTTFQRLLVDSNNENIWKDETYYSFSENKCTAALKAQNQCRQTVSALQHFIAQEEKAQKLANELKE